MANRKKNKGTRAEPGFNPDRKKQAQKYKRIANDAFGQERYASPYSPADPTVSQGTLFSHRALMNQPGNAALKAQRVGPRGYSKARLDEVRAGVGEDKTLPPSKRPGSVRPILEVKQQPAEDWMEDHPTTYEQGRQGGNPMRWATAVSDQQHMYGTPWGTKARVEGDPQHPGRRFAQKGQAELLGTLARSTMPAEHLQELHKIRVEPRRDDEDSNVAGTYHYDYRGEANPTYKTGHMIKLHALGNPDSPLGRSNQEFTLMHELGHHWSAVHSGNYEGYDTPHERGVEEAKADTYALQHYRQDPRSKAEYGVDYDPRDHTYGGNDLAGKFQGGYKLAPENERVEGEHIPFGLRAQRQKEAQPMLDAGHDTPVFTDRPHIRNDERIQVPTQGGDVAYTWQHRWEPQEKLPSSQTSLQDDLYSHESYRNTQRVNRREDARLRRDISQRWSVGRQFKG